ANANIVDISQTTLREFFTMILMAALGDATIPFDELKRRLIEKGGAMGVKIDAQHEDVFKYMHRVCRRADSAMPLPFSPQELVETIRMVQMENLDIRTITMGISLRDCAHPDLDAAGRKAYEKICRLAGRLVAVGDEIEREYGIPVINKRISVTPVSLIAECTAEESYVR